MTGPTRASSLAVGPFRTFISILAVVTAACGPAEPFIGRASAQSVMPPATIRELPVAVPGGYTAKPLSSFGVVSGSVSFDGDAPADSITHPAHDAEICGRTLIDPTVQRRGPRLGNAVVWITGITAGKPLPLTRRFDLVTETCRILPRVQTALVGGMLNVRSVDAIMHRTRFVRGTDTLAVIPETEDGQVVPTEKVLTAAGLVEVTCDLHTWSRSWLMVFDQPYFTTSNTDGAFTIDSVPPGRYVISVWHERFGVLQDSVTVAAGHNGTPIEFRFRVPAVARPNTPGRPASP